MPGVGSRNHWRLQEKSSHDKEQQPSDEQDCGWEQFHSQIAPGVQIARRRWLKIMPVLEEIQSGQAGAAHKAEGCHQIGCQDMRFHCSCFLASHEKGASAEQEKLQAACHSPDALPPDRRDVAPPGGSAPPGDVYVQLANHAGGIFHAGCTASTLAAGSRIICMPNLGKSV